MKKIITTVLLLIWILLILVLSFQNGRETARTSYEFTKAVLQFFMKAEPDDNLLLLWDGRFRLWAHFGLFFMYGMIAVAVMKSYGLGIKRAFLAGILSGAFFAVGSEAGKLMIEGRHCDYGEMGWNLLGVLIGTVMTVLLWHGIRKIRA